MIPLPPTTRIYLACGATDICSEAAVRSVRSTRGHNRAAALLRGAAPGPVISSVAGMVLPSRKTSDQ